MSIGIQFSTTDGSIQGTVSPPVANFATPGHSQLIVDDGTQVDGMMVDLPTLTLVPIPAGS